MYVERPENELVFEGEIDNDIGKTQEVGEDKSITYYYPKSDGYREYFRRQREVYYAEQKSKAQDNLNNT